MDRRRFILGSTGALTSGLLLPGIVSSAAAQELPAGAVASGILDALPGKRPLIKRTFRPPNYETPVSSFREAFTPNDAFYVRWHTGVPDIRAGGLALADCRTGREVGARVHARLAAPQVQDRRNRCRQPVLGQPARTLHSARGRACNGAIGAMGNAVWSGVRLKDVLEDAGLTARRARGGGRRRGRPDADRTPDFVKSLPSGRRSMQTR